MTIKKYCPWYLMHVYSWHVYNYIFFLFWWLTHVIMQHSSIKKIYYNMHSINFKLFIINIHTKTHISKPVSFYIFKLFFLSKTYLGWWPVTNGEIYAVFISHISWISNDNAGSYDIFSQNKVFVKHHKSHKNINVETNTLTIAKYLCLKFIREFNSNILLWV